MKDDYLADHHITWQLKMNRAPWWGAQFQRMVGLVKQSLYKSIRGANLTWHELEETILDAKITLNNRPLTYLDDDVQLPVLTTNPIMFPHPNVLSIDADAVKSKDLKEREDQ